MRNNYSGQFFAFIVNVNCLPDPFLVKISRRTKTEQNTVELYKPNVLYCPREMEFILQIIVDDGELFKNHRHMVKQAMVSSIKSTTDPSNFKYSEMEELVVTAIINSEILKHQTLLTFSLESRIRSVASQT